MTKVTQMSQDAAAAILLENKDLIALALERLAIAIQMTTILDMKAILCLSKDSSTTSPASGSASPASSPVPGVHEDTSTPPAVGSSPPKESTRR